MSKCRLGVGGQFGSGSGQSHNMMRMLDMSAAAANGGGYGQRSSQEPGLSSSSPASSPQHSPPPPHQPRPLPSSHLTLPTPHGLSLPKSDSNLSLSTPSSLPLPSSSIPSSLPIFSSSNLAPDPFTALQDLRLSHPSLSQWLQHVNSNPLKTDPGSPRIEHSANLPMSDYQRN